MLCISGEELVNAIVTLPALALSVVLVNIKRPLGSAASVSNPPPAALGVLAVAGADAGADDEVAGALEEADDAVLLLLLDPPHAARLSASATQLRATVESLGTSELLSEGFSAGS